MKIVSLTEIDDRLSFRNICGLNQYWEQSESYNGYWTKPRITHAFLCIRCGEVSIFYKSGEKCSYANGDVLYLPKGMEYRIIFHSNSEKPSTMLINFEISSDNTDACLSEKIIKLMSFASKSVVECFEEVIALTKGSISSTVYISATFYRLLGLLADEAKHKKIVSVDRFAEIYPALNYLDSHIDQNTSITDLSKLCAMSETYFRKRFKQYIGCSPSQYRLHARVEKATYMLAHSDASIESIAFDLGFYDKAYFCKIFHKKTGVTPLQYRKTHN